VVLKLSPTKKKISSPKIISLRKKKDYVMIFSSSLTFVRCNHIGHIYIPITNFFT